MLKITVRSVLFRLTVHSISPGEQNPPLHGPVRAVAWTFLNRDFTALQTGQHHGSGSSVKGVPEGMPIPVRLTAGS